MERSWDHRITGAWATSSDQGARSPLERPASGQRPAGAVSGRTQANQARGGWCVPGAALIGGGGGDSAWTDKGGRKGHKGHERSHVWKAQASVSPDLYWSSAGGGGSLWGGCREAGGSGAGRCARCGERRMGGWSPGPRRASAFRSLGRRERGHVLGVRGLVGSQAGAEGRRSIGAKGPPCAPWRRCPGPSSSEPWVPGSDITESHKPGFFPSARNFAM